MPELPDVTVYVERIDALTRGLALEKARIASPFLVRTFDPPIEAVEGAQVTGVQRLGKQIVLGFDNDLHLSIHLMISGRLHWKERGAKIPGKVGLAAFDFPSGTMTLTEASSKKRAAIHVVRGSDGLAKLNRGGLEVFEASLEEFTAVLRSESHTVKRSLTDPDLFSGIGNAYSDEILHRARLSPVRLTRQLTDEEIERLFDATRITLELWLERLRAEAGDGLPERVTAFRPEMAVHGRFGKPCPDCGAPVQRIVYAENECNYCARCQTGGKLLADRGLSRLLKGDWPRTIDELEARKRS
jgi:formamidopyrimidine-DNA glycosylase